MLLRQIERIQASKMIDHLLVATSVDQSDDPLYAMCLENNIPCFRGDLHDVLDRFYQAAAPLQPQHVIRLTGDCPLLDPQLIDEVVSFHTAGNYGYTSNTNPPTFPDGLDIEVMQFSTLEKVWEKATTPTEREHVTFYIYSHPTEFTIGSYINKEDLSQLRWTVDHQEDFKFVEKIYEELYTSQQPTFSMGEILALLKKNLFLSTINKKFTRNEGLAMSLSKESEALLHNSQCPKSLQLQLDAKNRIPGMTQLLSKRPDLFSFGVWPGYYQKAKGVEVWDLDGNHYIDMSIGGIGANVLGYADEEVNAAVFSAIEKGSSCSLNCPEEVELADLLCEIHPWATQVRFARTGGEAVAIAVRIARAATDKDKVAFCGYHGWHDWYLAANLGTENALGEHLLPGLSPCGVPKSLAGTALPFRYNQLEELAAHFEKHPNEIGAIVMEPIRNSEPTPGFLEGVRALATKHGAILIIDEISAGFRLNTGGAHMKYNLKPDIAVFSKALGNGFPIAAVIGNDCMRAAEKTFISSTNWTERTGPAAAIATIQKHLRYNVGDHLVQIGDLIQGGWKKIGEKYNIPLHIGGISPLSHFSFEAEDPNDRKAFFVQEMLKKGFLASTSFYSMYAHQEDHVTRYLDAMDTTFAQLLQHIKNHTLKSALVGSPSVAGFKRLT